MSAICSISTRPLALQVRAGLHQIDDRRQRPMRGASSIAPLSLMHSACTPRAAKWRRVISGYLVATRTWLQRARIVAARILLGRRDDEPAVADAEIERHIDLGIVELHQHVVAGDAELRRAEGDEGGDVEVAHADDVERRDRWS